MLSQLKTWEYSTEGSHLDQTEKLFKGIEIIMFYVPPCQYLNHQNVCVPSHSLFMTMCYTGNE